MERLGQVPKKYNHQDFHQKDIKETYYFQCEET